MYNLDLRGLRPVSVMFDDAVPVVVSMRMYNLDLRGLRRHNYLIVFPNFPKMRMYNLDLRGLRLLKSSSTKGIICLG